MTTNTAYVLSLKSKGLSAESIKPPATSDNRLKWFKWFNDLSVDYDATDVDIHKYLLKKKYVVYMKIFGFIK